MTCMVNFVFALSQLQGVEWGCACFELNLFYFYFILCFLSRICLVGEKPDKELPGIIGARGDTV